MTINEIKFLTEESPSVKDEELTIPLDISDIISICKEFSKLGYKIQNQVESIIEVGVTESIKLGIVDETSLLHIEDFLKQIVKNPYFGEAVLQAEDCLYVIKSHKLATKTKKIILN